MNYRYSQGPGVCLEPDKSYIVLCVSDSLQTRGVAPQRHDSKAERQRNICKAEEARLRQTNMTTFLRVPQRSEKIPALAAKHDSCKK